MARREYFSFSSETEQFGLALMALIDNLSRIERAKIIPPRKRDAL